MKIVLDTNCLVNVIMPGSYNNDIWQAFRAAKYVLCVTNEILFEYHEILAKRYNAIIANTVLKELMESPNLERVNPTYRFNLITADPDDNKFVNCAVIAYTIKDNTATPIDLTGTITEMTLSDGNNIAMPTKTVVAGHIYNISRSAAPVLSAATTSDIGKVVGADGKIYANVAAAKAASTTACAIIAYVGTETGEDSYPHGLAIAMKDAAEGGYAIWSSTYNDESLTNYTDVDEAVTTAQSGRSNSQTSGFDNESDYPAFYAALHNTITEDLANGISAAPASGTSGWFLPSLYQWNMIVKGLSGQTADLSGSGNANYSASSLNTKIEAAGGTGLWYDSYWSSTESDVDYAWLFNAPGRHVTNKYKDYTYYVRSAFAF